MEQSYPFKILTSPDDNYKAIVVSLSPESLSDSFDVIKEELLSADITGKILFDYLLSTGQNNKRFFEVEFNGDFLLNTFKKAGVDDQIKKQLNEFYTLNYQYIANSMLSEPLKYFYKRRTNQ
jgi:hypothetical protein